MIARHLILILIGSFLSGCAQLDAMDAPVYAAESSKKRPADQSTEENVSKRVAQHEESGSQVNEAAQQEKEALEKLNKFLQEKIGMTVEQIMAQPNFDANALLPSDKKLVECAARYGCLSLIQSLVNNHGGKVELPALFAAISGNNPAIFRYLLSKNPAAINMGNIVGATLLHAAATHINTAFVRILLFEYDAPRNPQARNEITPLHLAAQFGRRANIKLLLEAGAFVDSKGQNNSTPLHSATKNNCFKAVEDLLKAGAAIDAHVTDGSTALHFAAFQGCFQSARILLDHGADINKPNVKKVTPLHQAAFSGNSPLVELLLHYNADITVTDSDGETPWHVATNQHIKQLLKEAESRIAHSVDPQTLPSLSPPLLLSGNQYPSELKMCIAASQGNIEELRNLMQRRSSSFCSSPLHVAIKTGQTEAVKILLENDSSLALVDNDGNTPLHCALLLNHVEMAQLIIDAIVKTNNKKLLNAKNKNNCTPLMIAAVVCLPTTEPVIARLLELGVDRTGYEESLPDFMRLIVQTSKATNNNGVS